jgi:hypothetical protein
MTEKNSFPKTYYGDRYKNRNISTVVFVEEMNTCSCPGLMKEIFGDKSIEKIKRGGGKKSQKSKIFRNNLPQFGIFKLRENHFPKICQYLSKNYLLS